MTQAVATARRYACRHNSRTGTSVTCAEPSARLLETFVVQAVRTALTSRPDLEAVRAARAAEIARRTASRRAERAARLAAEEAAARARRDLHHALDTRDDAAIAARAAALRLALERLDQLRTTSTASLPAVDAEAIDEVLRLTVDFDALWSALSTTDKDRHQLIRAALDAVIIHAVTPEAIDLELVWSGGLHQRHSLLRFRHTHRLATTLKASGKGHDQIIAELLERGAVTLPAWLVRPPPGMRNKTRPPRPRRPARPPAVDAAGIRRRRNSLTATMRELILSRASVPELVCAIKHRSEGLGRHTRLAAWLHTIKRQGVPLDGELHRRILAEWRRLHPSRLGDRLATPADTLTRICDLRRSGLQWKAIAERLNAQGLRSKHGKPFTDVIVSELFHHHRKTGRIQDDDIRPYGLPAVRSALGLLAAFFRSHERATRKEYLGALDRQLSARTLDDARQRLEDAGYLREEYRRCRTDRHLWVWIAGDTRVDEVAVSEDLPRATRGVRAARVALAEFFRARGAATRAEYLTYFAGRFSCTVLDPARRALERAGNLSRAPDRRGWRWQESSSGAPPGEA